jgi:hypothetical protein
MNFGTGLSGSVVGGLYGGQGSPASAGQAGRPAASSGPTGRPSLMSAAWGTGTDGQTNSPIVAAVVSAAAWGGLLYLWWVLPK